MKQCALNFLRGGRNLNLIGIGDEALKGALRLPGSQEDADRRRAIAEHRRRVGVAPHPARELWKWEHHGRHFYLCLIVAAVIPITVAGHATHLS